MKAIMLTNQWGKTVLVNADAIAFIEPAFDTDNNPCSQLRFNNDGYVLLTVKETLEQIEGMLSMEGAINS